MTRGTEAPTDTISAALEQVLRDDGCRLLSCLIKDLRDLPLAEDCLQDAAESALIHWHRNGMPRTPAAWLLQVARRKAIDRIRRGTLFQKKQQELELLIRLDGQAQEMREHLPVPDERLSLIFTCCHPALDEKTRIALTLRTLGGLTTDEIARAFLDTETAMAQRLVRAKQKIAKAAIAYRVPEPQDLPERLTSVLLVICLIFNEGFYARRGGRPVRHSLVEEAIRLARLLHDLRPDWHEVTGLLALLLLNAARLPARLDADGAFVPLDAQNRRLWDAKRIAEGTILVQNTLSSRTLNAYLVEAAISALHCAAPNFHETDWRQILQLYDELLSLKPSPVIRLNRAIALSFVENPHQALAELSPLRDELSSYQPFHAARADLMRRCGRLEEAREAHRAAIALSEQETERRFIENRVAGLFPVRVPTE